MRTTLAILSLGILTIGCGGSTATDTSGVSTDAGVDDAASGASTDAATTTTGGARGPDGSVVADGGSGTGANTGPGGTTSNLPCGSATCLIPAETCCVTDTGTGYAFACVSGPTCPAGGGGGTGGNDAGGDGGGNNTGGAGNVGAFKCTSAANCPQGTVCCVTAPNDLASSSCQASCGPTDAQLCDPKATATGCPTSAPCSSANIGDWTLPASFGTCGGKGN
jgi:hypothetical protein